MKFGLDVSTAKRYSDPRLLADLAAEAEAAGWDGFFLMAGATWWREGIGDWRGSLKTVQERIRSGSPMGTK